VAANAQIVKMRGLPYQTSDQDIKEFFKGCELTAIHLVKDAGGRSSGEAFVVVAKPAMHTDTRPPLRD
jgi:RNA recognition motif-containing protein